MIKGSIFRKVKIFRAAIISGCFFICACENDIEKVNALTNKREMAEEAKNIEIIFSQGGKLKAKLTAPLMLRYQTDSAYIEFPKTLHVDFYDSLNRKESGVDALYGKYFESMNKVFLKDSVVVANVKGDTLKAPELWWDQGTQRFFTDKVVRIKTADRYIYGGKGMDADQDLSRVSIFLPTGNLIFKDSTAF
ncbi:MAG TPA: LPS export ABC transporter periplasmic protein LptC [Chitinophagaceae bacterium]|jgi:LPS export ABC transporter protein LptC|nr:LPS export ABC transporter periplasmic protein LptC [Chitinophagaceae bacterium]